MPSPSKVSNLRELVALLSLSVQVQREIADILEDYEKTIYALKEDCKRHEATIRKQGEVIKSLERRYSEVLYKLSE